MSSQKSTPSTTSKSTTSKSTTSKSTTSNSTSGSSQYNDLQKVVYTFLNKSNIILCVWFLALYFVTYYTIGLFVRNYDNTSNIASQLSRTLDIIFLLTFILFISTTYFYYSNDDLLNTINSLYTNFMDFITDGWSALTTSLFLIVFYVVLYLFQMPMTYETKPVFISFIENFAWVLLTVIVFIQFFEQILNISITDYLDDLIPTPAATTAAATTAAATTAAATTAAAKADSSKADSSKADSDACINRPYCTKKPSITTPPLPNEVFNVSDNIYTYDDAEAVCSIYGAKLATYDQLEESYKDGAEWCNYGWSDGQMIYYPTQKDTWEKLQKDPKTKNVCGRPGINGGFINNPYLKFGVNCYGVKPKQNDDNINKSSCSFEKVSTATPKNATESAFDKKVKYWKDHKTDIKINKFNSKDWSELNQPRKTSSAPTNTSSGSTNTSSGSMNTSSGSMNTSSGSTNTSSGSTNTSAV